MKEYLFEMHAHNAEVSRCAKAFAQELAERYIALGYDGIVSTNHLNSHTFSSPEFKNASWEAKAEKFMSGFRAVEKAVNGRLTVLLGAEVSLYSEPNDYLVYGVTEEFLKNNGDIMSLTKEELSALVHENGMLIVQAHPFRRDMLIADWEILDGYEVFNGNPRHKSSNEIAMHWAKLHGKSLMTSGSDFHESGDEGTGGMYFETDIASNAELLDALKNGRYRLKGV